MQHVEGIWALEERGVKAPSALSQRQQLEPTWGDLLPLPKMTGCWSLGQIGVGAELVCADVSREGSRPAHPGLSCLSAQWLFQLSGPPKRLGLESLFSVGLPPGQVWKGEPSRVTPYGASPIPDTLAGAPTTLLSLLLSWVELCPSKRYVETLTPPPPHTCECDLIWKHALWSPRVCRLTRSPSC